MKTTEARNAISTRLARFHFADGNTDDRSDMLSSLCRRCVAVVSPPIDVQYVISRKEGALHCRYSWHEDTPPQTIIFATKITKELIRCVAESIVLAKLTIGNG